MTQPVYVVVGLGKTGLSCVQYLVANNCEVLALDTREKPPTLESVQKVIPLDHIHLGGLDEGFLNQADIIILSPGISRAEPAIAAQINKNKPVIGDIELFCQLTKAPIIGITGSNGKSTVTTLVGEMVKGAGLNVQVGGNLGTPALDLYKTPEPDFYVLELSSFQLESTNSLKAKVAVNLNVSPDHMDRYDSLEDYRQAKYRIYHNCEVAVHNLDDDGSYPKLPHSQVYTYSITNPKADFSLQNRNLVYKNKTLLSVDDLKLKGKHQYSNALAALAIGTAINLPMEAMCHVLREFKGLAHRCQWVKETNQVSWFNDSKATNIGAAIASITSIAEEIPGKIVLLAGGQGKGADFSPLGDVAKHLRAAILFGEDEALLNAALQKNTQTLKVTDLSEAIQKARAIALPGDVVLLAPACASFDMFNNFEHRGQCFEELVGKLI